MSIKITFFVLEISNISDLTQSRYEGAFLGNHSSDFDQNKIKSDYLQLNFSDNCLYLFMSKSIITFIVISLRLLTFSPQKLV